jgi:hypothetical protein
MRAFDELNVYYGDLHNHCAISYGVGSLEEAFLNAQEQLDFCSVTGHALWPDMPEPDEAVQTIIDFHELGFARLRRCWPEVQRITEATHREGEFVTFLGFEMHSCADGDYTVLYPAATGEILEVTGLDDLRDKLRVLREKGVHCLAFPHHIAYRQGQRGINWSTFEPEFSPVAEIVSMHGCSEGDEVPRPFLHVMGAADHKSTMSYGLSQGHFFGVIGSTDHHSAHPGSYGHGRTGLWAAALTRAEIWQALWARRTYALTGDRIALQFAINDCPMGASIPSARQRQITFRVAGGAPIDYVDVVKNGEPIRRFSRPDFRPDVVAAGVSDTTTVRTKILLEVGWGERGVRTDWEVELGISDGRLLSVEPRFRGGEVVAPTELASYSPPSYHFSHWKPDGSRGVRFRTTTFGNPNNSTPAMQGVCLDVEMPFRANVRAVINGRQVELPLHRLLEGAHAGRLAKIGSAGYRLHRAPRVWEFDWEGDLEDAAEDDGRCDVYTLRVRQMNDQWAWSSPIRVGVD